MKKVFKILFILILLLLLSLSGFVSYKLINGTTYLDLFNIFFKDSLNYEKTLLVKKTTPTDKNEIELTDNSPNGQNNIIDPDIYTSKIINVLFLGIDRTEERDKTLGIYRADTICIAHIDIDTKEVGVLSIPRDTYTYLPITGKHDKINHSYAYGSLQNKAVESTIDAVDHFTNHSSADYYFSIEMEPIPEIVDSIGGVEVDVEIDMKTHGVNISKGLQILDGKNAFDYIHWRYSAGGDIDRIKRQQKFARALYKQLRDSGKLVDFVPTVLKYRKNISTNMTFSQMIGFAKLCSEIPGENIQYYLIPGHAKQINKIWYWELDEDEKKRIVEEFFK